MLIVPLKGDVITLVDDVKQTVKQYTGIKSKPSVYVVGIKEVTEFDNIKKIKNLPVELHSGVFKIYGLIKRVIHLPQPGEYVVVNIKGKQTSMLVKGIKVHSSNHLLGGMIVECENGEIVELSQIDNITGNFHTKFNKHLFLAMYKDYV